jgi:hypothetical protein
VQDRQLRKTPVFRMHEEGRCFYAFDLNFAMASLVK